MYSNARYGVSPTGDIISIFCDKDGSLINVPLDPANTDYQNIMKLVEDGELTIQPAEVTND